MKTKFWIQSKLMDIELNNFLFDKIKTMKKKFE